MTWFRSQALLAFLLVAFGWTWTLLLAAVALGGSAGHPLHLLGLLGPLLAWVWVVRRHLLPAERRELLRRVVDVRRVPAVWWAAVLVVGVAPAVLAGAAVAPFELSGALAWDAPTSAALLGAAAFALAAGLAEEPGWRGVAQDAAGPAVGELRGAVALAALWSLWHLPLYVLDGTYQSELGFGTSQFWSTMLVRVPLGVLLVWLVLRTRGAVVTAVVAHALGNLTGELVVDGAAASWAQVAVTTAAAVLLWRLWPGARRSGPTPLQAPVRNGQDEAAPQDDER